MKTKKEATLVARFWNEKVWNGTDETATVAEVKQLGKNWYQVEILPQADNDGRMFTKVNEMGGLMSAWNLRAYVTLRDGQLIGIIY